MVELDNDKMTNEHTVKQAQDVLDEIQISLKEKDYQKLDLVYLNHLHILNADMIVKKKS